MTEIIESDNTDNINENFEDLEIDEDLQQFINFVKNKESEKIPEPSPYVISTQSAWCKLNNIDNINKNISGVVISSFWSKCSSCKCEPPWQFGRIV